MKKLALVIISLILYSSCTKEYTLNVTVSPLEGGSVSPAIGTYKDGSSVSIVATPAGEYEFLLNIGTMFLVSHFYPSDGKFKFSELNIDELVQWKYTKPMSISLCIITISVYILMGTY